MYLSCPVCCYNQNKRSKFGNLGVLFASQIQFWQKTVSVPFLTEEGRGTELSLLGLCKYRQEIVISFIISTYLTADLPGGFPLILSTKPLHSPTAVQCLDMMSFPSFETSVIYPLHEPTVPLHLDQGTRKLARCRFLNPLPETPHLKALVL